MFNPCINFCYITNNVKILEVYNDKCLLSPSQVCELSVAQLGFGQLTLTPARELPTASWDMLFNGRTQKCKWEGQAAQTYLKLLCMSHLLNFHHPMQILWLSPTVVDWNIFFVHYAQYCRVMWGKV